MAINDPVTMRRKLRGELKRLRTEQGLTQRHVAEQLDWSQSKVIRIENGSVASGVTDLRALLQLYRVEDTDAIGSLVEMARGSKHQPFAAYKDLFPAETLRYFAYEQSSSIIRQVSPLVVPGLLQTEEYARALLATYGLPEERVDRIWESRSERQELLDRADPPEMFFIVDEAAVRRMVGGEGVMKRQLARLLELAARPGVTVQVLMFETGAHKALQGPFVYLEFPGVDDPDTVYLEGPSGDSVFRDDPEVTGDYLETFFALEAQASRPDGLEGALAAGAR